MNHPNFRLFSLLLLGFLFVPCTRAQDNATINGTVQDSTGAVISSAQVTLTNPSTGQVRTVSSNDAGAYRFANVGVGRYTLSASSTGFEAYTKTDIVVNVAQTLEENVVLAVGSAGQTVTVQADALQVQTETSEISTLISGQQVTQLATNGRNIDRPCRSGHGSVQHLTGFQHRECELTSGK